MKRLSKNSDAYTCMYTVTTYATCIFKYGRKCRCFFYKSYMAFNQNTNLMIFQIIINA